MTLHHKPTNLPLRLSLSFGVLLVLLLFLVGFSLYTFSRLSEVNRLNDQSHAVLLDTQRGLTALVDMETGARGFLITGKDIFLEPYKAGAIRFDQIVASLRNGTSDPQRLRELHHLQELHVEWMANAGRSIARRRKAKNLDEAFRGVEQRAVARKIRMDTMRDIFGHILQTETAVLEERTLRQRQLQGLTQVTLWLGAIFSIAFTAVLGSLVISSTRKVDASAAILAQANASLAESNARMNEEITERKRAEVRLADTVEELRRSNSDLEQFAYVASHDLQEPLRAVGGCVQVLKMRYQDKLDERGEQLIAHAVDGAQRMQNLINDLLTYSRVGTHGAAYQPVEMERTVQNVLRSLAPAIAESGALITHDPLPKILGDGGQLELVLQNLVSNAMKFKGERPPSIHIGCAATEDEYIFSVRDHGLGIDAQYFDRIFVMFQRLHTRTEFPGTGIGLAVCKKIVERHGGHIWVESELGQGSIFYFSIPINGTAHSGVDLGNLT